MKIQMSILMTTLTIAIAGCGGKSVQPEATAANLDATTASESVETTKARASAADPLICKAKKSKFRFDWQASSPTSGTGSIDQNSVSFDFRAANRPAGPQGENLKVGECGWALHPMANSKKEKSQVSYKKLSDEATETFYKIRTGKVFKLPVRQGKNGLVVPAGAPVTIIR